MYPSTYVSIYLLIQSLGIRRVTTPIPTHTHTPTPNAENVPRDRPRGSPTLVTVLPGDAIRLFWFSAAALYFISLLLFFSPFFFMLLTLL
jgi:hypothetical protein